LVAAQVKSSEERDYIEHYARTLGDLEKPQVTVSSPEEALSGYEEGLRFELIMARNLFSRAREKARLIPLLASRLAPDALILLCESVPSLGSRLSEFAPPSLATILKEAEHVLYEEASNALTNWVAEDLVALFTGAGFTARSRSLELTEERRMRSVEVSGYLTRSYIPALTKAGASFDESALLSEAQQALTERPLAWRSHLLFLEARLA